jgi:hypothetical protein
MSWFPLTASTSPRDCQAFLRYRFPRGGRRSSCGGVNTKVHTHDVSCTSAFATRARTTYTAGRSETDSGMKSLPRHDRRCTSDSAHHGAYPAWGLRAIPAVHGFSGTPLFVSSSRLFSLFPIVIFCLASRGITCRPSYSPSPVAMVYLSFANTHRSIRRRREGGEKARVVLRLVGIFLDRVRTPSASHAASRRCYGEARGAYTNDDAHNRRDGDNACCLAQRPLSMNSWCVQ